MAFEFAPFLEILKRQAADYVQGGLTFRTLYPTFLEKLKIGIFNLDTTLQSSERFWKNILEIQVKQLAAEMGGDINAAAKIVGQTYQNELAKRGLSLIKLKGVIPNDLAELLGFQSIPAFIARARDFVLDLFGFKRTGVLTTAEIAAARGAGAALPAGAAFGLGAAAVALPLYLFLRSKAQGTIDEIDRIEDEISKTIVVFKNRSKIVIDTSDKNNPKITESLPPLDTSKPIGSPENPVTEKNLPQFKAQMGRPKTKFMPSTHELTNLALNKLAEFIDGITPRLDFEIASKTNPTDTAGVVLQGKHIILRIYLKSGAFTKNHFADIILRAFKANEKQLTSTGEQPIEDALRAAIKSMQVVEIKPVLEIKPPLEATTPLVTPALEPVTTPPPTITPPAPVPPAQAPQPQRKPYVSYNGSPDVFDRQTGRWIEYNEAISKNIFGLGLVEALHQIRPEVNVASDYAKFSNTNLSVFPV